MLAIHGFSRTSADFIYFNEALLPHYTIIGINLFHHGNSTIDNYSYDFKLSKSDLKLIFDILFQTEHIEHFDIIAYSLGGKIALNLIDLYPQKISQVFLMAADGIKLNAWYNFVSNSWISEKLFLHIIEHPSGFFRLIDFLGSVKILPKRFVSFLRLNLETRALRENVFKTWKTFGMLHPDHARVRKLAIENNIHIFSLFGKFDLVIHYKVGEKFTKEFGNLGTFILLNCAHNVYKPETTSVLKQLIQKQKG